jgi:hypothetical protein
MAQSLPVGGAVENDRKVTGPRDIAGSRWDGGGQDAAAEFFHKPKPETRDN